MNSLTLIKSTLPTKGTDKTEVGINPSQGLSPDSSIDEIIGYFNDIIKEIDTPSDSTNAALSTDAHQKGKIFTPDPNDPLPDYTRKEGRHFILDPNDITGPYIPEIGGANKIPILNYDKYKSNHPKIHRKIRLTLENIFKSESLGVKECNRGIKGREIYTLIGEKSNEVNINEIKRKIESTMKSAISELTKLKSKDVALIIITLYKGIINEGILKKTISADGEDISNEQINDLYYPIGKKSSEIIEDQWIKYTEDLENNNNIIGRTKRYFGNLFDKILLGNNKKVGVNKDNGNNGIKLLPIENNPFQNQTLEDPDETEVEIETIGGVNNSYIINYENYKIKYPKLHLGIRHTMQSIFNNESLGIQESEIYKLKGEEENIDEVKIKEIITMWMKLGRKEFKKIKSKDVLITVMTLYEGIINEGIKKSSSGKNDSINNKEKKYYSISKKSTDFIENKIIEYVERNNTFLKRIIL